MNYQEKICSHQTFGKSEYGKLPAEGMARKILQTAEFGSTATGIAHHRRPPMAWSTLVEKKKIQIKYYQLLKKKKMRRKFVAGSLEMRT